MEISKIPDCTGLNFDDMSLWFSKMSEHDLLFHPDDTPEEIEIIESGKLMFSISECKKLNTILDKMFQQFGDNVYDAAYPFFMEKMKVI